MTTLQPMLLLAGVGGIALYLVFTVKAGEFKR